METRSKRYVFSKESERSLLSFYKSAKQNEQNNANTSKWKEYLPPNTEFVQHLEELLALDNKPKVIDLTIDSESIHGNSQNIKKDNIFEENEDDISKIFSQNESAMNQSFQKVEDFVFAIKETLENENELSESILLNLSKDCAPEQLENVFKTLYECIESTHVLKFGKSMITLGKDKILLAASYFKCLLLPTIFLERNEDIVQVFNSFFDTFPQVCCDEIVISVFSQNTIPKPLVDNFSALNKINKDMLLRSFLLNIRRIESTHFNLLETLLSPPLSRDLVKILIEALHNVAPTFSKEKSFGKLLLSAFKASGKNLGLYVNMVQNIIDNHQSIWKNQLKRLFESYQEEFDLLTQSFVC